MSRKPKPPFELYIEGLSTGKPQRVQEYDDFEQGKLLPMPVDDTPDMPLRGADVIKAERQRIAAANKRKLWTMLKPDKVPQLGQKVELIPKDKRKIAEWGGKAVLIDMPKWRRL